MTDLLNELVSPGRPIVATERELRLGAVTQEPTVSGIELLRDGEARIPFGVQLRDGLKQLDPRSIEGSKLPIIVLGGIGLITALDNAAVSTLLPNIQSDLHQRVSFLIGLTTVVTILSFMLGPVIGYLVDRVKRIALVIPGVALMATAGVLGGTSASITQLVAARASQGLAAGVTTPASFPLLTDYYPPKSRGRTIAAVVLIGSLGTVFGPPLAGLVGGAFGWRVPFFFIGVLGVVLALLALRLREPRRGAMDRLEMGEAPDVALQAPPSWAESWRAARSIRTLRRLWLAIVFVVAGSVEVTGTILPLYYKNEFHLDSTIRGLIGGLSGIAGLLGLAVSGAVTDRLVRDRPERVLSLFGGVLVALASSFVLLCVSPYWWVSVIVALPASFGTALLVPGFVTLISLVVPARFRGLGIQTLAPFQVLGLVIFFVVYEGFGNHWSLKTLLLFFAPLVAIGGMIIASAAGGFERDMRAAIASSVAELEARRAQQQGKPKMIICRDLDVDYDGTRIVFGVDFDVDEGEIVALLGTNGAGKSTLLRAISGIVEPATGAVFLDGADVTHVPADEKAKNGVCMLPGGASTFPTLSVEDNLRTALWMRRGEDNLDQILEDGLDLFPVLRDRRREMAGNLSGGEQQMLGLAQAFITRPRLLLIDELSLGLAPAVVGKLLDTLRGIHAQGTTIVLVEQSVNVALTIAKRAVFMEKGEIRFDGPTEQLLTRPDLMRAVYLGATASSGSSLTGSEFRSTEDAETSTLLEVQSVSARFGGIQALSGVNLSVDSAEIVGIIGPNGAGKTTLMDVICGLVPINGGAVRIVGQDVTGIPPHLRAKLGLARSFQDVRLFPALTVRETIAVALERHLGMRSSVLAAVWAPNSRAAERRIGRRVERLIDLLGLGAFADKFVNELSTGSRRLVDIACVMGSEPKILLLDEPASGLAQAETEELGPVIQRLVRETSCAALVIEHDMPLITAISDRLVAMTLGEVIAAGSVEEVINDPAVLRSYLSATDEVIVRSGASASSVIRHMEKVD